MAEKPMGMDETKPTIMIAVRGPTPLQNVFILSDQFEDFWYLTPDEALKLFMELGALLFPPSPDPLNGRPVWQRMEPLGPDDSNLDSQPGELGVSGESKHWPNFSQLGEEERE